MPSKQKSPEMCISKDSPEDSEIRIRASQDALIPEIKEEKNQKESTLKLKLSATLIRKLNEKAQIEGVSIQDLVSELLAEGLVLRAWEIVEKKNAMRGTISHQNSSPTHSYRNPKVGFRNHQGSAHVKRMSETGLAHKNVSRQNYKNIMDDNANFLEYVRNQEKRDRF